MKLIGLRPMLWTKEFEETIDFYTNVLGFTIGHRRDDWGWASLRKDGFEIMLSKPTEHTEFDQANFTGSFYFNTDNVEELWQNLKGKARVCYEIESFPWDMREFGIFDNNGYLLQFGQDIMKFPE